MSESETHCADSHSRSDLASSVHKIRRKKIPLRAKTKVSAHVALRSSSLSIIQKQSDPHSHTHDTRNCTIHTTHHLHKAEQTRSHTYHIRPRTSTQLTSCKTPQHRSNFSLKHREMLAHNTTQTYTSKEADYHHDHHTNPAKVAFTLYVACSSRYIPFRIDCLGSPQVCDKGKYAKDSNEGADHDAKYFARIQARLLWRHDDRGGLHHLAS